MGLLSFTYKGSIATKEDVDVEGPLALDRSDRAERLKPLFELQLRLAAHLAKARGIDFATSVGLHTTFHRRLGFGDYGVGQVDPGWLSFVQTLTDLRMLEDQIAWGQTSFIQAPDAAVPDDQREFGCFRLQSPDKDGTIRLHFRAVDLEAEEGPLAPSQMQFRINELKAIFSHVRLAHPEAISVKGGSWLYNIEAYRRLYPPLYTASRALPTTPLRLYGHSSWGQFITHQERIKPLAYKAFLERIPFVEVEAPWLDFPLRAMVVEGPLSAFFSFYGLQ